jgi:shikimate O-hydroxycinnamoyltransferase
VQDFIYTSVKMGLPSFEVRIRKHSMVPPCEPTPQRTLWNSNVDLVIPRIHTQSVYFYLNDARSPDFLKHEILVEALGKTLVPFYPMAGRLKKGDKGRMEIDCNAAGVLLVEAEADAKISEFGEFAPDPRFRQLVPQIDYSCGISSYPLLVLQVGSLSLFHLYKAFSLMRKPKISIWFFPQLFT